MAALSRGISWSDTNWNYIGSESYAGEKVGLGFSQKPFFIIGFWSGFGSSI